MAKDKSPQKKLADLDKEMRLSFREWDRLRIDGGSDPFWSDGVNMNLVRNHILYYRGQINEICENHDVPRPECVYLPVPPEVDNDYMAKADEIREKAKIVLEKFLENEDFHFICENFQYVEDKDMAEKAARIRGTVSHLERLVSGEENLVEMRRFVRDMGEHEIMLMARYAKQIKELPEELFNPEKPMQLSLF